MILKKEPKEGLKTGQLGATIHRWGCDTFLRCFKRQRDINEVSAHFLAIVLWPSNSLAFLNSFRVCPALVNFKIFTIDYQFIQEVLFSRFLTF